MDITEVSPPDLPQLQSSMANLMAQYPPVFPYHPGFSFYHGNLVFNPYLPKTPPDLPGKTCTSFSIDAILGRQDNHSQSSAAISSAAGFDAPKDMTAKNLGGKLETSWKTNKTKRVRTIFTPEQLERLEAEFERQQYMVGTERYYLANALNLTEAQVKVWYQNRRIKWRKQTLERQQRRLATLQLLRNVDEGHNSADDSDQG